MRGIMLLDGIGKVYHALVRAKLLLGPCSRGFLPNLVAFKVNNLHLLRYCFVLL